VDEEAAPRGKKRDQDEAMMIERDQDEGKDEGTMKSGGGADVEQATLSPSGGDWGAMLLPLLKQPPKPLHFSGMGALERLALSPQEQPGNVLLVTREFVVAYDLFPKAKVHLLIMPRLPISGPSQLRREHVPMLGRMQSLARWLESRIRMQYPQLAPMRAGFHSVPSMRQLHMHLLSLDYASDSLKSKKHFNSFATDFFVPPASWERMLLECGELSIDKHAQELKLKQEMQCPFTAVPLKNMPTLKAHLASPLYLKKLAEMTGSLPC
ncbi:MAG: hypothetical protein SGPRY_010535, partial [Prymnesium sp.]